MEPWFGQTATYQANGALGIRASLLQDRLEALAIAQAFRTTAT
ncbi:hypothetical protein MRBBS_3381 [Marinobacter sp. BSs20148]|nr:hypothetical protein MRBBS_3381 [Marinobacter sp. BSs20148]